MATTASLYKFFQGIFSVSLPEKQKQTIKKTRKYVHQGPGSSAATRWQCGTWRRQVSRQTAGLDSPIWPAFTVKGTSNSLWKERDSSHRADQSTSPNTAEWAEPYTDQRILLDLQVLQDHVSCTGGQTGASEGQVSHNKVLENLVPRDSRDLRLLLFLYVCLLSRMAVIYFFSLRSLIKKSKHYVQT